MVEESPPPVDVGMMEVAETVAAPVGVAPVETHAVISRGMSVATTVPATEEEVNSAIVI